MTRTESLRSRARPSPFRSLSWGTMPLGGRQTLGSLVDRLRVVRRDLSRADHERRQFQSARLLSRLGGCERSLHSSVGAGPTGQARQIRPYVTPFTSCAYLAGRRRRRESTATTRSTRGLSTTEAELHWHSRIDFSRARSFRFARRIAAAINGATILEKPLGSPRFRRVIRVRCSPTDSQV